jgi:hypothetical protein
LEEEDDELKETFAALINGRGGVSEVLSTSATSTSLEPSLLL